MYQALYRKWRPQTFDAVIGQEHVTETLKNQIRNDRLSHAYLFIGSRGTGKTTCARILARAVNCEHPVDGNPCGECAACRGILDGTIMDVVELDAASNNGVDNVRALREEALFSPTAVRKRVYIIDEVHMLSTAAFNALLKILEEPPEHLMFILATTELQKVPATILSRCQRHSFRRIDAQTLTAYLESIAAKEQLKLSHEAAELIARLAEGGVRDALSLLDQCSAADPIDLDAVYNTMGLAGNRRVAELLDGILNHDTEGTLRRFNGMWMDGKSPASLLGELGSLMRDVLMLHVAPKGAQDLLSGGYDSSTLSGFARRMTTEELLCAMETLQRATDALRDAKNPKMTVELCLVSLCDNAAGESIASLRARISRLEEDVARGIPARQRKTTEREVPAETDEDVPCEERREAFAPSRAEEEDDLDLSQFQEEQPEDAFLHRRETEAAPQPTEAAPQPAGDFKDVIALVKPMLPMDLRFSIDDEKKLRTVLEGSTLRLEAQPGFMFERLKKQQDVVQHIAEAARKVYGRELRVQLVELRPEQRQVRDLEELRKFPEVHFADK